MNDLTNTNNWIFIHFLIFVFKCVISVCDYFVHEACQEFAVPNCVESATYDPAKSLNDPKNCTGTTHHFQEGNLPNNSKCVKCRRSCWSVECLTGMRCQWCGITVHAFIYSHKILIIAIILNSDISFYLTKSCIVFLQLHTSCLPSLPSNQSVCQFGPLEPIFLPPPCISIPRTQLSQHNAVTIKGNSKGSHHVLLQPRKFIPR